MLLDIYSSILGYADGGLFAGILIGWAIKKVLKLFAIIAGLFMAGLAILQYQQIVSVNWDKLEQASEGAINAIISATTKMIDGVDHSVISGLAKTNFGIPITSSMSIGFTLGFMKG
jgi:uncharacterized membrane protein (Fun14 family)